MVNPTTMSRRRHFRGSFVSLFVIFAPQLVRAADDFHALPPDKLSRYRIDLRRNFFTNDQAVDKARAQLTHTLSELEKLKEHVRDSGENLLRAFQLQDEVLTQFSRLYDYFYLKFAIDTTNRPSLEESEKLEAEVTRRTAFLDAELRQLDERTFSILTASAPSLEKYRFAAREKQRSRPFALSVPEEELLQSLLPFVTGWPYELYQNLLERTSFETVAGLNPQKQWERLARNPDRDVRKAAFENRFKGFEKQRDLYAFALLQLVKARQRIAQLHHFADAPSEVYFRSSIDETDLRNLLRQVGEQTLLLKHYQQLRAEHALKSLGYSEVHRWDLEATPGLSQPRFTIDQATEIIRNAVAPLGSQFGTELKQLLDPRNGRIDIVPGPHRKSGGFSKGFIGVPSVFFSGGFEGSYNDMRVLAHEATHAVHRQLMTNAGVLPIYAEGPHYLFETYAIFTELLFADYLVSSEPDPKRKLYFLEKFFDDKGMELFYGAQDAALEQAIYDGVGDGTIKNADDLDAVSEKITRQYSIWVDSPSALKDRWMTAGLLYEDPLYYFNYLYAGAVSLRLYALYLNDPQSFAPKYSELMRHGFDAPAGELLKKYLGIDLKSPELVSDSVALLRKRLKDLEIKYSSAKKSTQPPK
jgi:oligoendopeptidase F